MKYLIPILPLGLLACGASYSAPVQRMADAQAAYRAAKEAGADSIPQARLHLKLADEQFVEAQALLEQDENRRADFLLIRSKADAELALAMAQEVKSQNEAKEAKSKLGQPQSPAVAERSK